MISHGLHSSATCFFIQYICEIYSFDVCSSRSQVSKLFWNRQMINILNFMAQQSVATTQPCHYSVKAAIDNM